MLDFVKKHKIKMFAGIALLCSLVFYSLSLRQKEHANSFERTVLNLTTPVAGSVSRIDSFFSSIWTDYLYLVIDARKTSLETITILNKGWSMIMRLSRNTTGLKTNGFEGHHAGFTRAALVVGEDSSPWFRTVTIDRGEVDGIRERMPVVASGVCRPDSQGGV
jgi:rod shape-determining protein MreC